MSALKRSPFARLNLEALDGRDLPSVFTPVSEAESNNTLQTAQVLPTGEDVRVAGSISTLRDVDFYRIPLLAGQRIALNCHDTSGQPDRRNQLDPMIALFDPG